MRTGKAWALGLSATWIVLWAVSLASGFDLLKLDFGSPLDLMVLAGGPACLLLCAALSFKREQLAGSLLWVGSAAAAMGLGLRSGPHVGRYFLHMAIAVLPQMIVATLFLVEAKRKEKGKKR